ncbi:conjugal transfer protein TraD [Serratia sp. CY56464]|uniref:conjugal transfer protein TraD n=1 Tax=Serratia sp. CY56464 TaxID=3383641 RepID=UPI003F9F3361
MIFGTEVAKVLECDISYVDKELVFGVLLNMPNIHESDVDTYKAQSTKHKAKPISKVF